MKNRFLNIKLMVSFLAAALFITACSDDEDTGQYYQKNLRDLTVREYVENGSNNEAGNAKYTTLYAALAKANLLGTLEGEVTLFAPSNAAFEASGVVLDDLSADQLANMLSYHIVSGQVEREALAGATTTSQSSTFNIVGDCINGVASIGAGDINLSNGVIHEIDAVLFPPTGDIVDKLGEFTSAATPEFTLLEAAIVKAGLAGTLSGTSRFTLFAPTDEAFIAAGIDQAFIDAATPGELADILEFHILAGESFSCALATARVATIAGALDQIQGVDISTEDGISVNGASVTTADVVASNGVIHIVDEVIFPVPTILEALGPDINISGFDGVAFDPMYDALVRLGYDQTFLADYQAEYTVYGPCCGSFNEATYIDDADLQAVVDAHIFDGSVNFDDIGTAGGTRLESIAGDQFFVTSSDNGVFINGTTSNAFGAGAGTSFTVYNGLLMTTFPILTPLPAETVQEQLAADVSYDLFAAALAAREIATMDMTVLALDNTTFTAIYGYATVGDVEGADPEEFADLDNHVIPGVYFAVDLDDGTPPDLSTSTGGTLIFSYVNGALSIIVDNKDIGEITLTGFDVYIGANGVVHEVDDLIEL